MPLLPLAELLAGPRPDGWVVAERAGQPLSLGALRQQVAGTAGWLRAQGTTRALLVAEDAWDFLAGLLALLHADAEAVLPPNAQPGTLAALAADIPPLRFPLPAAPAVPLRPLDAEACRLAFYTSGSTGDRKRIGKSLAQLQREVAVLEALWGPLLAGTRCLGMVSHQHIFGLTFRLLWPVMAGRPFSAHSHFAWESLVAALAAGPAVAVVSPAHLARLEGLRPVSPALAPRAILTAGAPLAAEAARQCQAVLGVLPTEIFGSTETGAIAWRRQDVAEAPWRPLPGTETWVREGGLLTIRSPNLAPGEVVESADRVLPCTGGFRFAGRADRIVKVEGKRVSLDALERDLVALPEVAEVALAMHEDTLGALLVPSAEGRALLAEEGRFRFERRLRRALADRHEPSAMPRLWRFLPALPLDAMGKRDRAALAALLAEAAPREPVVTALRTAPGGLELDLALPPGLFWFQGHFPDFPLLPGVVQVHWALGYARQHLGLAASPAGAQLKFRRPLRPWDRLTLALAVQGRRLSFTYRRDGEACATGSLALA